MPFPDPEGRIRHAMDVMHRAEDEDGNAIAEGWIVSTDGNGLVGWVPPGDVGGDADSVYTNEEIIGGPGPTVEADLAELFDAIDWSVDSVGSLTPDGTPATIIDDDEHNNFPGLARLDASRVLVVFRRGTDHASDGNIVGMIGTLEADHANVASWGDMFTILDDATLDLRCEDAVAVIDGRLVIAYRTYDGADNHDPSIMICDDTPSEFTSSSTWGTPIALPDPGGTVQEYTQGRVWKHPDGTYLLGGGFDSGGNHTTGVFRWTGTLEDAATASFVTVGSGANDYSEITLGILPDGTVRALLRSDTNDDIDTKTSADSGATWSSVADAYDGHGNPMWRYLDSTLALTVYRDSPNGDTAWRSSSNGGGTWGSETILDTTGTRSAYATLLQLTPYKILCAYAIEYSSGGATGGADIFSQVFTDSSTFAANITAADELVKVSADDTTSGYLNGKLVAGSGISLTEGSPGGNETLTIAATGGTGVPPPILLESGHAVPFTFDEILQESDGSDFLWSSA